MTSHLPKQNIFKYSSLVCLLLWTISGKLKAQPNLEPSYADSLWSLWSDKSSPDTVRLGAMDNYAWDGYLFTKPDSAVLLGKDFLDLAKKAQNYKYQGAANNLIATAYYFTNKYDSALLHYEQAYKSYNNINFQEGLGSCKANIANVYKEKGNFALAIENAMESLKIRERNKNERGIINSLEIIGTIYSRQENYPKAKDYFKQALKRSQLLGDKQLLASAYTNVAAIFYMEGEYDSTKIYTLKSLDLMREIGDIKTTATVLSNMAELDLLTDDLDEASKHLQESLDLRREYGDMQGIAVSLNTLGEIYKRQGKLKASIAANEESLKIATEIQTQPEAKEAAYALWKAYKENNNPNKALWAYERYIGLRDSLLSIENEKALIEQELGYKYEKKVLADSVKNAQLVKVKDAELKTKKAENKWQRTIIYFSVALLLVILFFVYMVVKSLRLLRVEKAKVDRTYEELEEKNTEILDSISYAKRIQSAILPPEKLVKQHLENSFVLYKPKDIVAGDFYWMEPQDGEVLFAAADCTGHGVPGAMVSVICNNGLNRSVREYGLKESGEILDKTREIVISEFQKSEEDVKDGMDIALCSLSTAEGKHILKYAGANNPLWIVRKGADSIEEIKAHKEPIGKCENPSPFPTHEVELNEGDSFYIFSDGFADQFGGVKGKKLKSKSFKQLILSMQDQSMEAQKALLDKAFEDWRGEYEQLDDVCVIGVRV